MQPRGQRLRQLVDVAVGEPAGGEILLWDATLGRWVPHRLTAGDLPAHTHAPTDITPQGTSSGLDADTVDGQHATAFASAVHTHTPQQVVPQGAGSTLDADLLDGRHADAFADAQHTHAGSDISSAVASADDADTLDGQHAAAFAAAAHTHSPAQITPQGAESHLDADTVDGLHADDILSANRDHDHDDAYVAKTGDTMTGELVVSRGQGDTGALDLKTGWRHIALRHDNSANPDDGSRFTIENYADYLVVRRVAPNGTVSGELFRINPDGTVSASGNTIWHTGNDGTGSGLEADLLDGRHAGNGAGQIPVSNGTVNASLNADTVDGRHAADFAVASHHHNADYIMRSGDAMLGTLTIAPGTGTTGGLDVKTGWRHIALRHDNSANPDDGSRFTIENYADYLVVRRVAPNGTVSGELLRVNTDGSITASGNTVWHAGNDGQGSGLDADTVRGWFPRNPTELVLANDYTLTTTATNILSVGMASTGVWLITAVVDFHITGESCTCIGDLYVGGSPYGASIVLAGANGTRATVSQTWKVTTSSSTNFQLRVRKSGGSGSSKAIRTQTRMIFQLVYPG